MKKILLIIPILLLTGCTNEGEEYICTIDGKEAIFTLKDGIVSSYTLDGEKQNISVIDEINGQYFTSSTNNEEGKEILQNYVNSLNGTCDI